MTVQEVGTACDTDSTRVQSQATNNLVGAGVSKNGDINEAPDWGLIIGNLVMLLLSMVVFFYSWGTFSKKKPKKYI